MYFPQIVDGGRHAQALNAFPGKARSGGDGAAQFGHQALVTRGIRIAFFNRRGQRLNDGTHVFAQSIMAASQCLLYLSESAGVREAFDISPDGTACIRIGRDGYDPWCMFTVFAVGLMVENQLLV